MARQAPGICPVVALPGVCPVVAGNQLLLAKRTKRPMAELDKDKRAKEIDFLSEIQG